MRAVILAAGVGSRLGNPFPKSLSFLPGGERILGRQIRIMREAGIDQITVVVGFKKELIMEEYPEVDYCYNPVFYLTNTCKSLLRGLEYAHEDVIWTNGDVVFDEATLARLIDAPGSCVLVDKSECGDEEVKYRTGAGGFITEISKQVQNGEGEAVGMNKVAAEDLPALIQGLSDCNDSDYFEYGIELAIGRGAKFSAIDISEFRCIEVDFEEDLARAREMFADKSSASSSSKSRKTAMQFCR